MTLLLTYASVHGSTSEMAHTLAMQLQESGYKIDFKPVEDVMTVEGYDAVIIGAPIHSSILVRPMHQFLYRSHAHLSKLPLYAWVTCMRVLEENGYAYARRHYVMPEFHLFPKLRSAEIFAGKIIPAQLIWQERLEFEQHYDGMQDVIYSQGDHRDWLRFKAWGDFIIDDLQSIQIKPSFE